MPFAGLSLSLRRGGELYNEEKDYTKGRSDKLRPGCVVLPIQFLSIFQGFCDLSGGLAPERSGTQVLLL